MVNVELLVVLLWWFESANACNLLLVMIAGCCKNLFPLLILSFNNKFSSLNLSFYFCKFYINLLYFFYVLLIFVLDLELSNCCLGGDLLLLLFCKTFYDDCLLTFIFSSRIFIISDCLSVIIFSSYKIVFSKSYVLICRYLFWYYNCNLFYFSFWSNFCVSYISLINFAYKNCFDDWRLCFDFR